MLVLNTRELGQSLNKAFVQSGKEVHSSFVLRSYEMTTNSEARFLSCWAVDLLIAERFNRSSTEMRAWSTAELVVDKSSTVA